MKTYTTYVRPMLEYNTPVWSPFLCQDIDKIEKVQRYFTRRLPGFQNLSYAQRLKELQLDSLELRRIVFDLIEVYKMVMQTSFLCFDTFFEHKLDQRTRGHRFQLRLRRIPRLEICKNFFSSFLELFARGRRRCT